MGPSTMTDFVIRKATNEDCRSIMNLIQELATFENMTDGPKIKYQTLEKDGFGEYSFYKCFVGEVSKEGDLIKEIVGYSLYFLTYSKLNGKSIYMEDLYVTPKRRQFGIGKALWKAVVKEGLENECNSTNFSVLGWNTQSIGFYESKKAFDRTTNENIHLYRLTETAMKNIARILCINGTMELKDDDPEVISGYIARVDALNPSSGQDDPEKKGKGSNASSLPSFALRPAVKNDCLAINKLIKNSSKCSQKMNVSTIDAKTLEMDGFGQVPCFKCIVAELPDKPCDEGSIVGYALYFYIYSTWEGKSLFMEDLYVEPHYRLQNIGRSLLKAVVQDGLDDGCSRVDCTVEEDNNSGIHFMKKHGSIDLTQAEDWHLFRLNKDAMINFAS